MGKKTNIIISLLLASAVPAFGSDASTSPAPSAEAAPADTIHLGRDVVITARRTPVRADILPVQTLSGDELRRLNSNSVADALRYFSGVQVKDYGGVGGIKTVNIRSMGTNHTGVVYDGMELGNAQNGQIDLGQFSLDNIEAVSLYNGQRSQILQPAKDFGSAGTVYMRTRTPHFAEGERVHARATLRAGSFDLFNPSVLAELKLSESLSAQLSAEYLTSSGKYKFRYRRVTPAGELAYDTTAVRQNGDIDAMRLEVNLHGLLRSGSWSAKAYHYSSERGVPGAIVNNVWRRGERIWDNNSFAQARYTGILGRFTTLNNIKYACYKTHYVNNDDKQIKVDNHYTQKELYISSSNEYALTGFWRASVSYDMTLNTLWSDMYGFASPTRLSNFIAAATALEFPQVKVQASALGTFIHDRLKGQESPSDKHVFTPAAFVSVTPLRSVKALSLRAFYKRSFRMPTFNDLYYADMGNSKLSPERVAQYNVGILYDTAPSSGLVAAARLSADVYYNRVKDKIVAYPKGQQFRWTMLNLGVVSIKGIDVSGLITVRPLSELYLTLRAQYTFQRAIDVTNPEDNYYRHQIPYIPRNSGSVVANAQWRGWSLNYSWIYVGERYNQQENIRYNYTQPWYTSDISASYDFRLGKTGMRVLAEVNNLLSQDYDVILNYPMPKRNYRFTLVVEI